MNFHCLDHRSIRLFIKSVTMNAIYMPKYKANFNVHTLTQLTQACDRLPAGYVCKAAFLLGYFVFLRLSNIPPSSTSMFDPTRNLLRGDVIFGSPGAHVIIKWAKAMQACHSHQVVQIPTLPSSPLCPVSAIRVLLASVNARKTDPLFLIPKPTGLTILTSPMISANLAKLLTSLHLNPSHYGFHYFRSSAVSWAADHIVPLQNLKAHGGWSSSAIMVLFG